MIDIARRAEQETTRKQNFARKVEEEKRRRRGGAAGDVVPLGKRKEPEPDMPKSILRKPTPMSGNPRERNTKQRMYGPRTQVFDMSREAISAY